MDTKSQVTIPSSDSDVPLTQQEIEAKNLLKGKLRFADEETVQREIRALEQRITLDSKHARLEGSLDGDDGRPKYDRREVEDYMRHRGDIFDPEVAYREMYRDELLDWEVKKAISGKKPKPYSAQPTASLTREDGAITREKITEMQSKGKAVFLPWYKKNFDKIQSLMADGKL